MARWFYQKITLPEGTMATREQMNTDQRFKYLRVMKERYEQANRKDKSYLLDEMQSVTGLHRKYLITRMNGLGPYRQKRCRERSRLYGAEVERAIALIGNTLDWICAKRLKPALPKIARQLAKFDEMDLTPGLLQLLEQISISTVQRILQRVRPAGERLPQRRQSRRSDSTAQALVPISVIPWQQPEPGHFEVDLVHHSRSGMEGPFVCTIQFIDVLTGWSERFAILGHAFGAMWQVIHDFDAHCPIPVREIHTDNGPEFINLPLIAYFGREMVDVSLTRGQPGIKNHNRFVEQKNSSLVRAYFGNLYLYTPRHVRLMNELYKEMWLYYNFFQPVLRQIERSATMCPNGVCRIKRKQDEAKTPLDRLSLAIPPVSRGTAQRLQALYEQTNPHTLKQSIHEQLDRIYQLSEQDERRKAHPPVRLSIDTTISVR